jgi:hypothetical protein
MMGIEYFVTYHDDYPASSGKEHVFFLNAKDISGNIIYANLYLESHNASSCFIDHATRISEISIPEDAKVKILREIWLSSKY